MNTQNINVFARWKVKPGQLETVLPLIHSLVAESRKEPGNIEYTVCEALTDPYSFHLFERYTDMAAIEAHKASAHFQQIALAKIVPLLEEREVFITKTISEA